MRRALKSAAVFVAVAHIPLACRVVEVVYALVEGPLFDSAEAIRNIKLAQEDYPS